MCEDQLNNGVNKINDKFSLELGLQKVKIKNSSEENLEGFLDDLRGKNSIVLPGGDNKQLNLEISNNNQNQVENNLNQKEIKQDLIKESAELNLNLPEQKKFNEVLDESLELAEKLLSLKKTDSLDIASFNKEAMSINAEKSSQESVPDKEFSLELIAESELKNPVIENAFVELYTDIEKSNEEVPEKLNKILVNELETVNDKIETDTDENLYTIILDYAKSDKSLADSEIETSFTELRLEVLENIDIELDDEIGLETLSTKDQNIFNLIDEAEEKGIEAKELEVFSDLINNDEEILAETLVTMKSFDSLDQESLELIDKSQNLNFSKEEKEEFSGYLVEKKGSDLAKNYADLKEAGKLDENAKEEMHEALGEQLIPDKLSAEDIENDGLKPAGPGLPPIEKMTLIQKGLLGLLEGHEVRQLIDIVGKFNLLKFGLESHLTHEDYEKLDKSKPEENLFDAKHQKEAFKEILSKEELVTEINTMEEEEYSGNILSPQVLMSKGLKGELKPDEIITFIELVGRDNLLKYGLESYPLGLKAEEYDTLKESILGNKVAEEQSA